ncbi:MAG: SDR family oxidoreductase [Actinomycetota bacterium]
MQSPLAELSDDDWDACLALNLTAVWEASVIAAERMIEGGVIINISSRAGDRGVPGSGHYAAAKAGVNSLTKTLSLELAPAIRVNGISPGFVPTEVMMTALGTDEEALEKMAHKLIPLRRLRTPNDMGSTAVYLASDAGSWMTGQTLIVAGGL